MAAKPHMQACEVRQTQYSKHWQTEVLTAAGDDPCYCCYAFWCSCCASYSLRKRAIGGDMSRYICCAGYLPCSGRCGEQKCPACCLCAETFFCFAQSVMGTRWMLQDRMQIQNTKCDNCLIGTMVVLQYVSCIFSIVAMVVQVEGVSEAARIIDCISDLMWASVCACMQTQHKIQLDALDANPGLLQPFSPFMAPIAQTMAVPMGYPAPGAPHPYAAPQQHGAPHAYPPPGAQQQQYYPPPPPGAYPPPPVHGYPPPAYQS